jgi:hypothetical protein
VRLDPNSIINAALNSSGSQDTFARYTAGLVCIALIGLLCFRADYVLVGVFLAFVLVVMWTVLFARFRDIR